MEFLALALLGRPGDLPYPVFIWPYPHPTRPFSGIIIIDANDLPLIVAGGKSAGTNHGKAIRYERLDDRRLCNLHLAMAQQMGCPITEFGNSHYPLPGVVRA